MSYSYWGYWLILFGVGISGLMIGVQGLTTTNTQDYYSLKEITEAAMLESVDYGYYRDYNEVKMNKEKFMEVFIRMIAEEMGATDTYEVNFYKMYEAPPKVSVEVKSHSGTNVVSTTTYDVVNRVDAILQVYTDNIKQYTGNVGEASVDPNYPWDDYSWGDDPWEPWDDDYWDDDYSWDDDPWLDDENCEFYGSTTYYSVGTMTKDELKVKNTIDWEYKLDGVSKDDKTVLVVSTSHFNSDSDFNEAYAIKGSAVGKSLEEFKNSSLGSDNFTETISSPYKKGNDWYVKIHISINNTDNLFSGTNADSIYNYYFPYKFDIASTEGENCEYPDNEVEYCKESSKNLYSTVVFSQSQINSGQTNRKWKVRINNLINADNLRIENEGIINTDTFYQNAYNYDKGLSWVDENNVVQTSSNDIIPPSANILKQSSLTNYTLKHSNPYKCGIYWCFDIDLTVNDTTGITPYYNGSEYIYYVPYYYYVKYVDTNNCNETGGEGYEVVDPNNEIKYCKKKSKTFYSVGYYSDWQEKMQSWKVKLNGLYMARNARVSQVGYVSSYEAAYLSTINKDLTLVDDYYNPKSDGNVSISSSSYLRNNSLMSNQFSEIIENPILRGNEWYTNIHLKVDENIIINDNREESGRFVPYQFTVSYTDTNDCTTQRPSDAEYSNYEAVGSDKGEACTTTVRDYYSVARISEEEISKVGATGLEWKVRFDDVYSVKNPRIVYASPTSSEKRTGYLDSTDYSQIRNTDKKLTWVDDNNFPSADNFNFDWLPTTGLETYSLKSDNFSETVELTSDGSGYVYATIKVTFKNNINTLLTKTYNNYYFIPYRITLAYEDLSDCHSKE